jgi:glutathione synthase/RimK-type ligase-like ATP-grasp enzyme
MYKIAIQRDRLQQKNGKLQSFSDYWLKLAAETGIEVRVVNVFAPDFIDQLADCDGFMWRFGFRSRERLLAKRLLPAVEHGLGIQVFPSWKTAWHFEDKVAQHYLLQAAGIPTPRTWSFWKQEPALEFCREASYPLVMKLAHGFQSMNVRLLQNADEATYWVHQMFGPGVTSLKGSHLVRMARRLRTAVPPTLGKTLGRSTQPDEVHHGYILLQEFLAGNDFDTRVTVIGNRAFAFRRFNRPNDFRASGSGLIDWDPAQIDLGMVRLAFRVARQLGTQSVAIDGLRRGEERLINEISYTYVSWLVRDCPGHWVLSGDPASGRLDWVEGHMTPEEAIFKDFVVRLSQ